MRVHIPSLPNIKYRLHTKGGSDENPKLEALYFDAFQMVPKIEVPIFLFAERFDYTYNFDLQKGILRIG